MKKKEKNKNEAVGAKIPSGIEDLMRIYQRFQEAYAVTEHYLDIISPKTHQSNSNQSFVVEGK